MHYDLPLVYALENTKKYLALSLNVTQNWRLNESLSYEILTLKEVILKIDNATDFCRPEDVQTTSGNSILMYDHDFTVFGRIFKTSEIVPGRLNETNA